MNSCHSQSVTTSVTKRRKLCSLGTGEFVHIINYRSLPDKVDEFEVFVQETANSLYHMKSRITDMRVCHPRCGEVCFIITFLTQEDLEMFRNGPQRDFERALENVCCKDDTENSEKISNFTTSGSLMPAAHTLNSLLCYLKLNVVGESHSAHNVRNIQKEINKWFPRKVEYEKYVHWDECDPSKYTRNLIFSNLNMDVILMCWPPESKSSIHDHDKSSCWVVMVEGSVYEIQYALPQLDRKFMETEMKNPTGAVGRCGKLRIIQEYKLDMGGCTSTYANNDIGLHCVENRTSKPAYTLHVYAPPLSKMKIFRETGEVTVHKVTSVPFTSREGTRCPGNPGEGILDVEAWNSDQYNN